MSGTLSTACSGPALQWRHRITLLHDTLKTLVIRVLALTAIMICVGAKAHSHTTTHGEPPSNQQSSNERRSKPVFDRVWGHTVLFQNERNRFALSGRMQIDSAWFDADQGQFNDILWRRFRFGFTTEFAGNWTARFEGDFTLNQELGDLYNRITDAYIGYSPNASWSVKALKQGASFTLDGATSSTKLLTLERNNLTNNLWFTAEYFTGLSVSGTVNSRWRYKVGVFSSDDSNEIEVDSGGTFALLSLGYNLAARMNLDKALIRLDYVNNDQEPDSNTPDFSQVASLSTQWEKNKWGLRTDLSGGEGFAEQSDLWGFSLMPFYSFTAFHQVVLRYTYLDSSDDNGIRLGRYEREIVSGRGNRYNEIYAGFNLFFYSHKLKWQTGLQYTTMEDDADDGGEYDGWGLTTGLRMYW